MRTQKLDAESPEASLTDEFGWAARWIPISVAAIATPGGIALILSAPLDDDGRNNLGSALISAALIGVSLLWIERYIDHRRQQRENRILTERQEAWFIESTKLALGSLVIGFVQQLALAMMSPVRFPDSRAKPVGWKGSEDHGLLVRGLMWAAELPERDRSWWKDARLAAAVDAIFIVASDVAERSFVSFAEIDPRRLNQKADRAASRVAAAAARLNEVGDPYRAHKLETMVEPFYENDDTVYGNDFKSRLPEFGVWGTESLDAVIVAGGHFDHMRRVFAYCSDRLRGDFSALPPFDADSLSNDEIASLRWSELIADGVNTANAWDSRFEDESWLRRILDRATVELRQAFGAQL